MDKLTPPNLLGLDSSNGSDVWRKWKQHFELFSLASCLSSKEEETQAATILHVVGPDTLEIYNTFTWEDDGDKSKVAKILENSKHILRAMAKHHVGKTLVQYSQPT